MGEKVERSGRGRNFNVLLEVDARNIRMKYI
jgi:hypothetical protein